LRKLNARPPVHTMATADYRDPNFVDDVAAVFSVWAVPDPDPGADPEAAPSVHPLVFGANVLLVVCGARPAFRFTFPPEWEDPPKCGLETLVCRGGPGRELAEVIYSRGPLAAAGSASPFESMLALGRILEQLEPHEVEDALACGSSAIRVDWRLCERPHLFGWDEDSDVNIDITVWFERIVSIEGLAGLGARLQHVNRCLRPTGWSVIPRIIEFDRPQCPGCRDCLPR